MFLQWLSSVSKPDATYDIVETLLTMVHDASADDTSASACPWQDPDATVIGSMKVVRVTGVKRAGKHFHGVLVKYLEHTARHGGSGPHWQGFEHAPSTSSPSTSSASGRRKWQLFAVIKDFGQDEPHKKLGVPTSVLRKPVSSKHPAYQQVLHSLFSALGCRLRRLPVLIADSTYYVPCCSHVGTSRGCSLPYPLYCTSLLFVLHSI